MAHLAKQEVRLTPIAELRHHPRNPRKGHAHSIAQSIEANGFYGTVVAQVGTSYILVGNHRVDEAQRLGIAEIPVAWVEVDDETALRILVADNRTGDLAGNDDALLAELLAELSASSGIEGTGFDQEDMDALLRSINDQAPDYEPVNKEIDPGALLGDQAVKCPRCGFEFETT